MDLIPHYGQHTLEYLTTLSSETGYTIHDIGTNFLTSLHEDGYEIIRSPLYLRRHLNEAELDREPDKVLEDIMMVLICIICAAFASGLTQGLLSLDLMEMRIKATSGTEKEKNYARQLIPIICRHHLLLVTLMLWNASAMEAMPIFLAKLVPEAIAIALSVTLVLLFGEILPASILTGPKQLEIAASLTPVVYGVLFFFFPIAYPIAKVLDYVIGHDEGVTMYNRREIHTMMKLQHEEGKRRAKHGGAHDVEGATQADLMAMEEVAIIGGALTYRDMKVSEVMTPLSEVYMIPVTEKLSYRIMYDLFKSGYSRIPVYEETRDNVIGLLLAKDLIFIDPEDETPVRNFVELFGRAPMVAWHDETLATTLHNFRHSHGHMAAVRDVISDGFNDPRYVVVGIITLEDIIEVILGTEINDETDMEPTHPAANKLLRDMDLARLKSIRAKSLSASRLAESEVNAVVKHLYQNVPEASVVIRENPGLNLREIVSSSDVMTISRCTPVGMKPYADDVLIRKGKVCNACLLVLEGTLQVIRDDLPVEYGPWSIVGIEVLSEAEGAYVADFTAVVYSEVVRFVRLSTFTTIHADNANTSSKKRSLMRGNSLANLSSLQSGNPTGFAVSKPGLADTASVITTNGSSAVSAYSKGYQPLANTGAAENTISPLHHDEEAPDF